MSDLGALARDLAVALAPDRVRARALDLVLYRRDASIIEGEAGLVCFPLTTDEVVAAVRAARRHGVPFVARGSGTGLAGGAVPLHRALVVVLSRMNRILEVDVANRAAWVEPGVINLDLSTHTRPLGLHYAPDPSSQQTCSIGGNVATNSGGPHCLASGVTADHVLGLEVVLPDGEVVTFGGLAPEHPGLDLRGLLVGSEGTLGIVTKVLVRLLPDPPAIRTMLLGFPTVEGAAATASGIIAAGLLPAALEMMDRGITVAVENFVHAGLPLDAAAILLVEVDGLPAGLPAQDAVIREVAARNGATHVRLAADEAERQLLWKGRKSAFGAIAQIAPNYYLHDCVVPRTRLVEVLRGVYAIGARYGLTMLNVFHAGDGNLHPLIVFDRREPGRMEQVLAAGREIIELCVAAGGVLSGEHGIGLEKRDAMPLIFSPADLDQQARLAEAFDPDGLTNPEKVLPKGSRCGEVGLKVADAPEGAWI